MALTIAEAQASILASNPLASAAETQRLARGLVSKSELLDMETAFASAKAERDDAKMTREQAANSALFKNQTAQNRLSWGLVRPGEEPANTFSGGAPVAGPAKNPVLVEGTPEYRDHQLLRKARGW
jgi:hypothetical protein